jgi:hypothetical protein
MRAFLLIFALLASPAYAWTPIPTYDDPRDLLVAVYDQIEASEDWETSNNETAFDEREAFSAELTELLDAANEAFYATGDEIGALDFSPFINGQDNGGMDFVVGDAKTKGDRSVISVDISLADEPWETLTFHLIEDGEAGWKVNDILLPMGDAEGTWSLAQYLADPALPE